MSRYTDITRSMQRHAFNAASSIPAEDYQAIRAEIDRLLEANCSARIRPSSQITKIDPKTYIGADQ